MAPPGRPTPRVSIVTLCFNQAPFAERAMRSVLEQDYPDIEYIVVDPGSTDGSDRVIARYRDRLAHVLTEPDDGPADGLNKGFAAASGDILGYLNADDALLPGAVGDVVRRFEQYPETDIVIGHGFMVDEHDAVIRRFRSAPYDLWRFAHGASVVMQQSTFFHRRVLALAGGFNVDNRTCWDAELVAQAVRNGARPRTVEANWSVFRVHGASITGAGENRAQYERDRARLFRDVIGRDPRPADAVWRVVAGVWRWAVDPPGAALRLRDTLMGPPRLPAPPRT